MQELRRSAALQAALRFVMASDDLSDHKLLLIDTLMRALRDEDAAELSRRAVAQAGAEWQEHEIAQLKSFLQGRLAKNWQHADEGVMQLAAQLHRDPRTIRDKAMQLGLAAAVDYRYAKGLQTATDQ
jgi:hypothetical protein